MKILVVIHIDLFNSHNHHGWIKFYLPITHNIFLVYIHETKFYFLWYQWATNVIGNHLHAYLLASIEPLRANNPNVTTGDPDRNSCLTTSYGGNLLRFQSTRKSMGLFETETLIYTIKYVYCIYITHMSLIQSIEQFDYPQEIDYEPKDDELAHEVFVKMNLIDAFNEKKFYPLYQFLQNKQLTGLEIYLVVPQILSYLHYLDIPRILPAGHQGHTRTYDLALRSGDKHTYINLMNDMSKQEILDHMSVMDPMITLIMIYYRLHQIDPTIEKSIGLLNKLMVRYTSGNNTLEMMRRILHKYNQLYPDQFEFLDESVSIPFPLNPLPITNAPLPMYTSQIKCIAIQRNGTPCRYKAKIGYYCGIHR